MGNNMNMEDISDKRWCPNCKEYIEPVGKKKNQCPECGTFAAKYSPEDEPDEEKKAKREKKTKKKGKEYKMSSTKPINLSGKDAATAEVLINAGFAKNFSDLVRKGVNLVYSQAHMPFQQQLNSGGNSEMGNPNPRKKMEELQEQNMLDTYIDNMRKTKQGNPSQTLKDLQEQKLIENYIKNMNKEGQTGQTDPFQFLMLKQMMGNNEAPKNNFTDDLMKIQMLKSLGGSGNQETASLQKEIADLKSNMQMQQLVSQMEGKQNKPDQFKEYMTAISKINADRDAKIREVEAQRDQQQNETLKTQMDLKLKELGKAVQETRQQGGSLGSQRVAQLKEEISAIKDMATALGERKEGTGEMVMNSLGKVAENVTPALVEMGKQRQLAQQSAQIPEQQSPPNPEIQTNPPNPGKAQSSSEQTIKSEMTDSEKNLSQTMNDMYLKEKKKDE